MARTILIFAGTRPEAIKLAPVFFRFRESDFRVVLISSGQHSDLASPVWNEFGISPTETWTRPENCTTPESFARFAIEKMSGSLPTYQPDYLVVQGDTSTAYAGAFVARQNHIPLGHVEAGLRSGNWMSPWPEELIRRGIATYAQHHFAPTPDAVSRLKAEQVSGEVFETGNTVIDAVDSMSDWKTTVAIPNRVLVTIHRRENQTHECRAIRQFLSTHTRAFSEYEFHLVRHPNPKLSPLYRDAEQLPNVVLRDPLRYGDFLKEIAKSRLIMTDSGGVQEEASFIGTPTIVLRDFPDRAGPSTQVVGVDVAKAADAFQHIVADDRPEPSTFFGDGRASFRIYDAIVEFLGATS